MQAEGSRWVLLAGLAWTLACGGEVRHNDDSSASLTIGGTVAGVGASETTWDDVATLTVAGAVTSTANSVGTLGGTSEAVGVTATSGADATATSSLGGAGGAGGTGAGGASVSGGGVGGVSVGGAGGGVQPSCTNPDELEVGGVPTGIYTCDEGHEVRAEQVSCPNLLPAKGEGGAAGAAAECTSHADCPGLGYCETGPFGNWCVNGCQTDADCGPGHVCRCGDPIGVCSEATCTTNDDCEPGSFCAGVVDAICVTTHRYACQLAQDECQSDGDCSQEGRDEWCTLVEGVRRCEPQRPCR